MCKARIFCHILNNAVAYIFSGKFKDLSHINDRYLESGDQLPIREIVLFNCPWHGK